MRTKKKKNYLIIYRKEKISNIYLGEMINTLIIEDNLDYVKNILNTVINKFNEIHVTNIATTKKEAMEIINRNNIDLIFLDLRLPDATGIEIIKEIDMLNLIKNPNIIIISGKIPLIRKVQNNYNSRVINKLSNEEYIYNHIKQAVKEIKYLKLEKQISEKVFNELLNIGYNFKYKGTHYIYEAIIYIYESNNFDLLDNLEQNVYKYLAHKYKKSINNIKTNIIKATKMRNESKGMYEKTTPKSVINNILIKVMNMYNEFV